MRTSAAPSAGYVEIQLNTNTLATRHFVVADPFRFHDGFTQADVDAGWESVVAMSADALSPGDIQQRKADAVVRHRAYWEGLATHLAAERVVVDGNHFVTHELGVGAGFGGQAFRVEWNDRSRTPLTCNLSAQGQVPGWLRSQLPDNATITDLRYSVAPRNEVDLAPYDASRAFDDMDEDPLPASRAG